MWASFLLVWFGRGACARSWGVVVAMGDWGIIGASAGASSVAIGTAVSIGQSGSGPSSPARCWLMFLLPVMAWQAGLRVAGWGSTHAIRRIAGSLLERRRHQAKSSVADFWHLP